MPTKNHQVNLDKFNTSELLTRRISEIIPSREAFEKALFGESKLTIYHGVDPTGPSLHLGHSTNYIFLRNLQKLGHKIVLLIGDFTARIGDPSGKAAERVPLTAEQIAKNLKTYKEQAAKILDFESRENSVRIEYNSKWLQKLTLESVIDLASHFTVQQMISREMFQKRIKSESAIGLNEFLYPLLQGYDSVVLKADMEVGGNDQLFNMLIGRDLAKAYLNKDKFVVTTKLLINPKTGNKLMSKSEGGYIALNDSPNEMYGKVMALPDEVVNNCFELCTEVAMEEIERITKIPPKEAKAHLAREIVGMYHGAEKANSAEAEFNKVFTFHQPSQDMPTIVMVGGATSTRRVLVETGLSRSRGEAKRLEDQGGVHVQMPGSKEWQTAGDTIDVKDGIVIRVGKRRFRKLKIKE